VLNFTTSKHGFQKCKLKSELIAGQIYEREKTLIILLYTAHLKSRMTDSRKIYSAMHETTQTTQAFQDVTHSIN